MMGELRNYPGRNEPVATKGTARGALFQDHVPDTMVGAASYGCLKRQFLGQRMKSFLTEIGELLHLWSHNLFRAKHCISTQKSIPKSIIYQSLPNCLAETTLCNSGNCFVGEGNRQGIAPHEREMNFGDSSGHVSMPMVLYVLVF